MDLIFPPKYEIRNARVVSWDECGRLRPPEEEAAFSSGESALKRYDLMAEIRTEQTRIASAEQALNEARLKGDVRAARSRQARLNCYKSQLKKAERRLTALSESQ